MKRFELVLGDVWEFPTFVHDFDGRWLHHWEYEEAHSQHTGLHVEIDFILYKFQSWLRRHTWAPGYAVVWALKSFLWGLNCGYPLKDVLQFTLWELRGCPPVKIWNKTELLQQILAIERHQSLKKNRLDPRIGTSRMGLTTEEALEEMKTKHEGPRSLTEILEEMSLGIRRQSRLILDNVGLWMNPELAYLVYALQKDLPRLELTSEEKKVAWAEQCLRMVQYDVIEKLRKKAAAVSPLDTGALKRSILKKRSFRGSALYSNIVEHGVPKVIRVEEDFRSEGMSEEELFKKYK